MKSIWLLSILFCSTIGFESAGQTSDKNNLIFVDKKGVMRYTKDNKEAAFFGVNYTVPFAYGYRSHRALGVDPEKAIDADVYHMARLGLDAFRVHVWDVEISDSLGNLIQNEHLRRFDYLLKKLKEHRIKILITPIAFWGNGYPEPDIKTNGFSYVYTKRGSVVKEEAFKAQENYLQQFFSHINPYTKLSYKDDPDVIAMEINNEPQHSGSNERVTEYVNRMAAAVKSTGWTKPIFYNISETPTYAAAVVKANVDGHSFQWYPTGLVAGHELKGNFLPNVDRYSIPFADTIPAYSSRAKMVYEFDAGDVMQPIMYPAMARTFRTAGFQWATQFAYDPLYTSHANTEYQTHYLNLVYTPAKAISLLIASKAFHSLPRGKSYGPYPADTLFDAFRVSYKEQLSEMNTEEEFYYTNNTSTQPKNAAKLKHIAGVGSSPVVKYKGTGAYFLDKIADGVWRLEVMPDVVQLNDAFEKASPKKDVRKVVWAENEMHWLLPNRSGEYFIKGLNEGNEFKKSVQGNKFFIKPGVYEVRSVGEFVAASYASQPFYAASQRSQESLLIHQPLPIVSPNKAFQISATVPESGTNKIYVELRNATNQWKSIIMRSSSDSQQSGSTHYTAIVPAEMVTSGLLNYRIILERSGSQDTFCFPSGFKGNPYAWDSYRDETYQTFVPQTGAPLEIFNPTTDRSKLMVYNSNWRTNRIEYTAAVAPGNLVLRATSDVTAATPALGWQYTFADKLAGRRTELSAANTLVVRARSPQSVAIRVSLITDDADAYSTLLALTPDWKEFSVPLNALRKTPFLLLPRPYPGFLPLQFLTTANRSLAITQAERVEVILENKAATSAQSFELEWIRLEQ